MAQPANFNFLARSGSASSSRSDSANFAVPKRPAPPANPPPAPIPVTKAPEITTPLIPPFEIGAAKPIQILPPVDIGFMGSGQYELPDTAPLVREFEGLRGETLDALNRDIQYWSNFAKAILGFGKAALTLGTGLPLKNSAEQLQSDALALQGRVNNAVGSFYNAKARGDIDGMRAAYSQLQGVASQANNIQSRGQELAARAETFTKQMSLFNYGNTAIGIGQTGVGLGTEIYKASTGQEYDPYKIAQSGATGLFQGAQATDLLSGVPFASLIPQAIGAATETTRALTSDQTTEQLGANFAGAIGGGKAEQLVRQGNIYAQQGQEALAAAMYASAGLQTFSNLSMLAPPPFGVAISKGLVPFLQGTAVFAANLDAGESLGTAALRGSNFGAAQSIVRDFLSVSNNVFGTQFWSDAPVSGAIREINTPITATEVVSQAPSYAAEKGGTRLRQSTDISLANELKSRKLLVQDIYQSRDQISFTAPQKFNAYRQQIAYLANKNAPESYSQMTLLTRNAIRDGFLPANLIQLSPAEVISSVVPPVRNAVPSGADFSKIAAE